VPSPSPLAGEGGARSAQPSGKVRERLKLLRERAREMRSNPTGAEKRLWAMLRDKRMRVFKFRRQVVIDPYIADFVCFERRLIIEADGSQHAESEGDLRRDAFLCSQGFFVLRFWNNDVLQRSSGVFNAIYAELTSPHPPIAAQWAPPSPARGEGLGVANG
jgi:very-short-patch-repair endonuclease